MHQVPLVWRNSKSVRHLTVSKQVDNQESVVYQYSSFKAHQKETILVSKVQTCCKCFCVFNFGFWCSPGPLLKSNFDIDSNIYFVSENISIFQRFMKTTEMASLLNINNIKITNITASQLILSILLFIKSTLNKEVNFHAGTKSLS